MMFRNLSISKKLFTLNICAILLLAGIGIISFVNMKQMSDASSKMYNEELLSIKGFNEARTHNRAIEANTYKLMMTTDPNERMHVIEDSGARIAELDEVMNAVTSTGLDAFESERMLQISENMKQFREGLAKVTELALSGQNERALIEFQSSASKSLSEMNAAFQELAEYKAGEADELSMKVDSDAKSAISMISLLALISVMVSGIVGTMISRMIVKPLKDMQSMMESAAAGNLRVKGTYQSKDEIGLVTQSFNGMIDGIKRVLAQVTVSAEQVAASSEQLTASAEQTGTASQVISEAAQELAIGAENQSSAVEEGMTIAGRLASGADRMSETVQQLAESAEGTAKAASSGLMNVRTAVDQMNSIQENVSGMSDIIHELGKHSEEIGQVVSLISDIASQTNLLALNAGIEAARAGEHGRGFSVVASEIRKLAEQSSRSAEQISELIQVIQEQTGTAVVSVEKTTHVVDLGMKEVAAAGASFEQIEGAVSEVADRMENVAAEVMQMAEGTGRIAERIRHIAEVAELASSGTQNVSASTQEQLAAMEEITASANHLTEMAQDLQQAVSAFKL
jgi:methyl-accepting chemotaxis protein